MIFPGFNDTNVTTPNINTYNETMKLYEKLQIPWEALSCRPQFLYKGKQNIFTTCVQRLVFEAVVCATPHLLSRIWMGRICASGSPIAKSLV